MHSLLLQLSPSTAFKHQIRSRGKFARAESPNSIHKLLTQISLLILLQGCVHGCSTTNSPLIPCPTLSHDLQQCRHPSCGYHYKQQVHNLGVLLHLSAIGCSWATRISALPHSNSKTAFRTTEHHLHLHHPKLPNKNNTSRWRRSWQIFHHDHAARLLRFRR